MDSLKDSLHNGSKTVTLSASHINYLTHIHEVIQQALDKAQETLAAEYLHGLAVREFGMDPNKDFAFDFHPEREYENLTITEKVVHRK